MSLDECGLEVISVTDGSLIAQKGQVKGVLLVTRAIAVSLWNGYGVAHFSCSTITNKNKLEAGNLRCSFRHFGAAYRWS
jgi:hypothetical protein